VGGGGPVCGRFGGPLVIYPPSKKIYIFICFLYVNLSECGDPVCGRFGGSHGGHLSLKKILFLDTYQ
jgi:hypothetical protein